MAEAEDLCKRLSPKARPCTHPAIVGFLQRANLSSELQVLSLSSLPVSWKARFVHSWQSCISMHDLPHTWVGQFHGNSPAERQPIQFPCSPACNAHNPTCAALPDTPAMLEEMPGAEACQVRTGWA